MKSRSLNARLCIVGVVTFASSIALAAPSGPAVAAGPEPKLELARLPNGDAIALELEAAGVGKTTSTVAFIRQTGEKELSGVSLLTNVTDPQVTIAVTGAAADGSFKVPKKGDAVAVTFTVQGVGAEPATSGEILADLGDRVVVVSPLTVRAPKITPSVTWDPPATALGRIDKPGSGAKVSVRLSVRESAGQDLLFPEIGLYNLDQKEWAGAGTKNVQAEYLTATFSPTPPIKLARRQTTGLTAVIAEIARPGLYEGTVRLSGTHTDPIEQKISVAVRYHWWVALVLIAGGVLASHYLRRWLKERRPQLLAQRRLAALREELDRLLAVLGPNPAESKIFAFLRTELRDLFARAGAGEDVKAGTDAIEDKLPVLARAITLRQAIEDAGAADLLPDLLPVQQWLRRPGTTPEEQKAQFTALEAIEKNLATAQVASLAPGTEPPPPPVPPVVTIPAEQDLTAELRRGERSVTFVLLVVALLLGLRLLYVNSMTWGQPLDLFLALLWGLGLHQVTAATVFGGIAGLRAQLGT